MTATWMCLLVSRTAVLGCRKGALTARRMIGIGAGARVRPGLGMRAGLGIFLATLAACDRAQVPARGSGGATGTAAEIAVGSLVCPDTAAVRALSAEDTPNQCPLLAVAVDSSRDSVRLIGPEHREYRLPASALKLLGPARIPEGLVGATDTPVERMAPGPNPGVLTPQSAFGLLFKNASGTLDTVFPGDLSALRKADGGVAEDIDACLDSLEKSPAYGLLHPPFAPDLDCGLGSTKFWKFTGDSVVETGPGQAASNPGTGGNSRGLPWKSPFSLLALAKPAPSGAPQGVSAGPAAGGQSWIFLLTSDRYAVWRMVGGKARILKAPFMENSELESIVAAEVDGDSLPELLLEVKTHDGDGFYKTLFVLKGGPQGQADDAPRVGSIGLEGSYAEADGSTVESDWWIRSPYIYHAYAQAANPGGRGSSHDTRLEAYGFTDSNGFARTSPQYSAVAYFGDPGSKRNAQIFCDSLSVKQPEASRAGLRPLPRRTSDGISWQAGAPAPDLATAKRWAGWDPSGKAVKLSFAPGRD